MTPEAVSLLHWTLGYLAIGALPAAVALLVVLDEPRETPLTRFHYVSILLFGLIITIAWLPLAFTLVAEHLFWRLRKAWRFALNFPDSDKEAP